MRPNDEGAVVEPGELDPWGEAEPEEGAEANTAREFWREERLKPPS